MVASELGKVPENWAPIVVGDLLERSIGGGWGKDQSGGEHVCKVRVIRGTDMKSVLKGEYGGIPTRYVKQSELESRQLRAGDLIVENSVNAKTRSAGTPLAISQGLLNQLEDPAICASFCRLLRPRNLMYGLLLYPHMRHLLAEGRMAYYQNVAANGIANFQSKRFLNDESIRLPEDEAQVSRLSKDMSPLLSSVYAEQICLLRNTRDLLLPKLISGELDVSDLDIEIPEEAA